MSEETFRGQGGLRDVLAAGAAGSGPCISRFKLLYLIINLKGRKANDGIGGDVRESR
jgi:hypothetical protein